MFLGGFTLLNLLGGLCMPGFDANHWWIDLRMLPIWLAQALLLTAALAWLVFAVRPHMRRWRVIVTASLTLVMVLAASCNAVAVIRLRDQNLIQSSAVSISALLALCLLAMVIILLLPWTRQAPVRPGWLLFSLLCCAIGFPLAQIHTFGWTDYSRQADIIVVPGAKVYIDGSLSSAASDRVRTACELYHAGLAPRILFSGGPGDGPYSEPSAMRRRAMRLGVPPIAIYLDEEGVDTRATVRNSLPHLQQLDVRRVLVVSHFFHLPRLKMTYRRAGWEVSTVPVRDQQLAVSVPFLVTREVAALWAYYLRPLWERG
ncbi:MAG: vancomycin high temperature exclusion protein [bacterium ADurb.Bin429]|nr:MAG: vancomycin high temperature exclusion protein [bacterium ADurb.Bin429]